MFRFIFRTAPIGRYLWGLLLGLWFCSGVFSYISTILGAPLLVIVPLLNFWTGQTLDHLISQNPQIIAIYAAWDILEDAQRPMRACQRHI